MPYVEAVLDYTAICAGQICDCSALHAHACLVKADHYFE